MVSQHSDYWHLEDEVLGGRMEACAQGVGGEAWGKEAIEHKCVFWFPVRLLSETFLIVRRMERGRIESVCILVVM
jgi:hypothetical protein